MQPQGIKYFILVCDSTYFVFLGQAIFIPVISLLGVSESLVLVFLYLTFTARFLIKAFATSTWMYYLGKFDYIFIIM